MSKRFVRVVLTLGIAASGIASALAACGGSTVDEPLVTPGADATADGASSSSSSSGSSSGGSSSGGSSGGSSSGGSSGGTDGGAPDATSGDGSVSNPKRITCGSGECSSPAQSCCTQLQQDGGRTSSCIVSNGTCQGVTVACDEAADCAAGQVCCATFGGPAGGGVRCAQNCNQGVQLCKTTAECGGGGRTCTEYTCFGGEKVRLCEKPRFGCE